MKRLGIIFSLILLVGCSDGLNKPITEELSVDELRSIAKKDTSFIKQYETYRDIGKWLLTDNILNAKYGDITYKKLCEVATFEIPVSEIQIEYDKKFPNADELHRMADSIILHYKSIQPDSLVSLSFKSKTSRKSAIGGYPIFNIEVNPLKGKVEQFRFEYYFSEKIQGERKIDDIPISLIRRGYQDIPITKKTTISYTGELWTDVLEDVSSEELLRDYNFIYKITNVRYKGENWNDIPFIVREIIELGDTHSDYLMDLLIKELLDKDYMSFYSFYSKRARDAVSEKYPTIIAMFDDYYAANPDF